MALAFHHATVNNTTFHRALLLFQHFQVDDAIINGNPVTDVHTGDQIFIIDLQGVFFNRFMSAHRHHNFITLLEQ